jgi:hypothetical protein
MRATPAAHHDAIVSAANERTFIPFRTRRRVVDSGQSGGGEVRRRPGLGLASGGLRRDLQGALSRP